MSKLGPVCVRVVEQWKCLKKYFLNDDHHKDLKESTAFKRICIYLQEGDIMLARLVFTCSIAQTSEHTLTVLQTQKPLIHVLLDELSDILGLVLSRFVKMENLQEKSGSELANVSLGARPVEKCDFRAKNQRHITYA